MNFSSTKPKPKLQQNPSSPVDIKRKASTSIISNILAKSESKPSTKARMSIVKSENDNRESQTAEIKGSKKIVSESGFRKNSLVFINSPPKKNGKEEKSKFLKGTEKDSKYFIDDPDTILGEITRFLKKRLYRKAFYLSEKFLSSRRSFKLYFELRYNRLQLVLINKISKVKFYKNQPNHAFFVQRLLLKGLLVFRNYFNFLTIFLDKKYPEAPFRLVKEEYDPLLRLEEDLFVMPNKLLQTLSKHSSKLLSEPHPNGKLTRNSSIASEAILEKTDPKLLFEGEFGEDDEFFSKVMEREKHRLRKLSDQAETFFFIKNFLDLLLNLAINYRNMGKPEISFIYFSCINKYFPCFESTVNEDLLHTLVKCKFAFGTFYSSFGRFREALKTLNEAVFLSQKEIMIRINVSVYTKEVKRRARLNFLSCVRTMVMILFSISLIYANQKRMRKVFETLELAQMFAEKFLQRIDAIRKFIHKIHSNLADSMERYFQETAEMERIVKEFLINDEFFQRKLKETDKKYDFNPSEEEKTLKDINSHLYDRFSYEKLNKSQLIPIRSKIIAKTAQEAPSPSLSNREPSNYFRKTQRKHKKTVTLFDEVTFSLQNTENNELISQQDLLNGRSFLMDDEQSGLEFMGRENSFIFQEFGGSDSRSYKEIMEKTLGKPLISKGLQDKLPVDYKPKVLTTNKCNFIDFLRLLIDFVKDFKKFQDINEESKSLREATRLKSEENSKEIDLDICVRGIISKNLDARYKSKKLQRINEDFVKHLKNEDFDKKEFSYCKKMLLMKRQENCSIKRPKHQEKHTQLNKNTTNNLVEKEAGVIACKILEDKKNDNLKQNLRDYQKLIVKQLDLEERDSVDENGEFKMPRLVELIFKHKEALSLVKVAKAYEERMKEREKNEKKALEENLKKQSKINKKCDFYNFKAAFNPNNMKSLQTLRHLLDNKKTAQSSYFFSRSHCAGKGKKPWTGSYRTNYSTSLSCGNFKGSFGSRKTEKFNSPSTKSQQTSEQKVQWEEDIVKLNKNYELAQNMIKVLSGDLEKAREEYYLSEKPKKSRKSNKKTKVIDKNEQPPLCDLAKSSFYLSLDGNVKKKILTFSELVKIQAKQHFKASSNFFRNSLFGTLFN